MLNWLYTVEESYETSCYVDFVIIAILALVAAFTTATFVPLFALYVLTKLVLERLVTGIIRTYKVFK